MKNLFLILLILIIGIGCTTNKTIKCEDPRPSFCTMQYDPVCATQDTGIRCITEPCPDATEEQTYPNACGACVNDDVYHYRVGACEE